MYCLPEIHIILYPTTYNEENKHSSFLYNRINQTEDEGERSRNNCNLCVTLDGEIPQHLYANGRLHLSYAEVMQWHVNYNSDLPVPFV